MGWHSCDCQRVFDGTIGEEDEDQRKEEHTIEAESDDNDAEEEPTAEPLVGLTVEPEPAGDETKGTQRDAIKTLPLDAVTRSKSNSSSASDCTEDDNKNSKENDDHEEGQYDDSQEEADDVEHCLVVPQDFIALLESFSSGHKVGCILAW